MVDQRGTEAKRIVAGPGDWIEANRSVIRSCLVDAFRADTRTIKTFLANCLVLRMKG